MKLSGYNPFPYFDSSKHTSGLGSRLRAANKRQQFNDSKTTVKVFEDHQFYLPNTVTQLRCQIHSITPASLEAKTEKQYVKQVVIMVDLLLHRLKKSDDENIQAVRNKLKVFKKQFISGGVKFPEKFKNLLRFSNALEASYVEQVSRDRQYNSYAQELVAVLRSSGV